MFTSSLPVSLRKTLTDAGITTPTPVQELALQALFRGKDVAVEAPTGSGKTLTFVLPLLTELDERPSPPARPRFLVLTPTRELALQVARTFKQFGKALDFPPVVASIIGGERLPPQLRALERGVDIVVATPGRLLDLVGREAIDLSDLETLVLDEADRLLDAEFLASMATLVEALPGRRSTWLFSATLPGKVLHRAQPLIDQPTVLRVTEQPLPVDTVDQRVFAVPPTRRRLLLQKLIEEESWGPTLVFVASRKGADTVQHKLARDGFSSDLLHGHLDQDERNLVVQRFRQGIVRILVVTDLAARGLDLPDLEVVVNFDLPRSPRDYLHRVGRAGRAGRSGKAVSFVDHSTEPHLRLIEKRNGVRLERLSVAGFEQKGPPPPKTKGTGGIKGKRKSKKDKLREQRAREAAEKG